MIQVAQYYEYLKGSGNDYIKTNFFPSPSSILTAKFEHVQARSMIVVGCRNGYRSQDFIVGVDTDIKIWIARGSIVATVNNTNETITVTNTNGNFYIDGSSVQNFTTQSIVYSQPVYLFQGGGDYQRSIYTGNFYSASLTDCFDMLPIKLIANLPAFLCADGFRHYKGESGLFNSIDNLFYFSAQTTTGLQVGGEAGDIISADISGSMISEGETDLKVKKIYTVNSGTSKENTKIFKVSSGTAQQVYTAPTA